MILGVRNQPWLTEMSNPEIFWSKMMVLAVLQILDWLSDTQSKIQDSF